MSMQCKLCKNNVDKLVKSHIIPKAIHLLYGCDNNYIIVSSQFHNQRNRTGVYSNIVCCDCEKIFAQWDEYGVNFVKSVVESSYKYNVGDVYIIPKKKINYHDLQMFFVSLLWRADASEHCLYKNVNVGKSHRKRLSDLILSNDTGYAEEYLVEIVAFAQTTKLPKELLLGIGQPQFADRIDNTNIKTYIFNILNLEIYIKCDQRSYPPSYKNNPLREDSDLIIGLCDLEGTNYLKNCALTFQNK